MNSENTWRAVFEHMGISILTDEKAELEFRKALYRHKFDLQWYNEQRKVENEHYAIMGAIIHFTRPGSAGEHLKVNPLGLPTISTKYIYEIDLPFVSDISDELLLML